MDMTADACRMPIKPHVPADNTCHDKTNHFSREAAHGIRVHRDASMKSGAELHHTVILHVMMRSVEDEPNKPSLSVTHTISQLVTI
jgi:hypothetical protein